MKMLGEGNADGTLSEKKVEEVEDNLRTVECLRGRLLAERVASRNAKDEAEIMGKKLIELETKLREETKSRNKAEKKLKFFMMKLDAKNISYVQSTLDIECQESVGSTKSNYENLENNCSEFTEERKSEESSINLEKDSSQMSTSSQANENLSAKLSEFEFSKSDANSFKSSIEEEEKNGGGVVDFQEDNNVNNLLALVPVDLPKIKQTIDPVVLDATVREVLDGLRHAKEKLQTQMERRQMVKAS